MKQAVDRANAKLEARRREQNTPSAAEVKNAKAKLDAKLSGASEGIRFSFNDSISQLVVQVVDQGGSVIRQIPSKEFVAAEAASQASTGLLLDKQG